MVDAWFFYVLLAIFCLHLLRQKAEVAEKLREKEGELATAEKRAVAALERREKDLKAERARVEGIKRQAENQAAMCERLLNENLSLKDQLRDLDRRRANLLDKKDD